MALAAKFGGLMRQIVTQHGRAPVAPMLNSVRNIATGFKACRLLKGNVYNKELTPKQRLILSKLRREKKNIKTGVHSRGNLNSYIKLQTTRMLSNFYGNLPIAKMHRRTGRNSYIPFLLNLETRLDVLLVRSHFCGTLPQARQLISHRKVCVNGKTVGLAHMKVPPGSLISFQEEDKKVRFEAIWKRFFIRTLVDNIIGKFGNQRGRSWESNKLDWLQLLKTPRGCKMLLKSKYLEDLHNTMIEDNLEKSKKFQSEKINLGRHLSEHNRLKRSLYHFKTLYSTKKLNQQNRNLSRITAIHLSAAATLYGKCISAPLHLESATKFRKLGLPTHYLEVNYKTLQAVVFYGPNIAHIPFKIKLANIQ